MGGFSDRNSRTKLRSFGMAPFEILRYLGSTRKSAALVSWGGFALLWEKYDQRLFQEITPSYVSSLPAQVFIFLFNVGSIISEKREIFWWCIMPDWIINFMRWCVRFSHCRWKIGKNANIILLISRAVTFLLLSNDCSAAWKRATITWQTWLLKSLRIRLFIKSDHEQAFGEIHGYCFI